MTHSQRSLIREQPRRIGTPWYGLWWDALTQPTIQTFQRLLDEPDTSLSRSLLWIFAAALGAGVISWGIAPGFLRANPVTGDISWSLGMDVYALVGLPAFLVELFVVHLVARRLGGDAPIARTAFVMACYAAPLIALSGLVGGLETLVSAQGGLPLRPYGLNLVSMTYGVTLAGLIARALVTLAHAALDVVAVRAVYQLKGWRAAVPSLLFLGLSLFGLGLALVPTPPM